MNPPQDAETMRCRFLHPYPPELRFRDGTVYLESSEKRDAESGRNVGIFRARKSTGEILQIIWTDTIALHHRLYTDGFLVKTDDPEFRLLECLRQLGFMEMSPFHTGARR